MLTVLMRWAALSVGGDMVEALTAAAAAAEGACGGSAAVDAERLLASDGTVDCERELDAEMLISTAHVRGGQRQGHKRLKVAKEEIVIKV